MRYLVQFVVPALIVLVTIVLLARNRNAGTPEEGSPSSNGDANTTLTFVVILVVGATVAVVAFIAIGEFL